MSSAPEQSEAYRPKYNSAKKWALPPDIIEDILTLDAAPDHDPSARQQENRGAARCLHREEFGP